MEHGFKFELNDVIYKNCFIESSRYQNGNLQLSLFGIDPKINANAHILDITLENNEVTLPKDQIIVDCFYRPTLIGTVKGIRYYSTTNRNMCYRIKILPYLHY